MKKYIVIILLLTAVPVLANSKKVIVPTGTITLQIEYKNVPLSDVSHLIVLAEETFKDAEVEVKAKPN